MLDNIYGFKYPNIDLEDIKSFKYMQKFESIFIMQFKINIKLFL